MVEVAVIEPHSTIKSCNYMILLINIFPIKYILGQLLWDRFFLVHLYNAESNYLISFKMILEKLKIHSDIVAPEPPNSSGISLNFGNPSLTETVLLS